MLGLPFEEEAKARGYTIQHYGADRKYACYIRDGIYLAVHEDLKAELSFVDGLIMAHMEFSLPNKHLDVFERKIIAWKDAIDRMVGFE